MAFQDDDIDTKWYRTGIMTLAIISVCLFLVLALTLGMIEDREDRVEELEDQVAELSNELWDCQQRILDLERLIEQQKELLEGP